MSTPEQPYLGPEGDTTPETVSVDDVLELLKSAATDVEISAELAIHDINARPRPASGDVIEQIEYDNDMMNELIEARAREKNSTLIEALVARVRELKRLS